MINRTNLDIGFAGEKIAQEFLINQGYVILYTNWRFMKDEIDIIAEKENELIIVEVKTRTYNDVIQPEEAVTKQKQNFIIRATNSFIEENDIDKYVRFDIVSVIMGKTENTISHIIDAFYPVRKN